MTDRNALLRAVLESPGDDLPRLQFADWLDEHDGTEPCGRCGGPGTVEQTALTPPDQLIWHGNRALFGTFDCPECDGSGRVPNHYADRAEFIRVQCRIARCERCGGHGEIDEKNYHGKWDTWKCGACKDDRRREGELVRVLFNQFALPGTCSVLTRPATTNDPEPNVVVRCGFVESVTCTAATFLGSVCPHGCGGTGWRAEWGQWRPCPYCDGTGRTPGIAADLFRSQPVLSVRLSDGPFSPRDATPDSPGWFFRDEMDSDIWDRLPLSQYGGFGRSSKWAPGRRDADEALSVALVAFGRAAAGLSPLHPSASR